MSEPKPTRAGELLRNARHAAGLSQQELAELAGTSQSAIATYEAGRREPTVPVLERMVRATGRELVLNTQPNPHLFRLTDLAAQIAADDNEQRHLRLVFEFLRAAADDGHPLLLLVMAEPPPTGDRRFDALLAAVAEDLCLRDGLRPPAWSQSPDRTLDGFWWVSDLPSARTRALVHTPASYRRRGIMIDRADLEAA
ncbi:MAG TPA: helix-turn-helix domain-containing protein [Euzebya sp.]|nr:helix-turn-helix domain-containing protein [Euzebya sp.]